MRWLPRGWWLVWALILVGTAPLVVLLWSRSTWLVVPLVGWALLVLRVGDRLVVRDVERELGTRSG